MQKLASVVIPTYNRAHSVADAIKSAKAQTYSPVQIIVIDDGSQDNSAEIIKQFKGIEYYYQRNKGQAAARNLGLKYAKGDYIASLDSDDIWNRDFLAEGIKCIEKHDLDFVFLNWTSIDGKENFIDFWERNKKWKKYISKSDGKWFLLDSKKLRNLFLEVCPSPSSSLLLRRTSLISAWNEEMIAADDWYLMLEMVISKPCRAAFTLSPYWIKRVFGDNVYDGRNILEVTSNSVKDDQLMARHLGIHLTLPEKYILRKRLALNNLNLVRLKQKEENISQNILLNIYKTFKLAPVSVSFHIVEILINHVKYRMKLPLSDDKLKDE